VIELRFYVALDTKQVISETFFAWPISWLITEQTKRNTTKANNRGTKWKIRKRQTQI